MTLWHFFYIINLCKKYSEKVSLTLERKLIWQYTTEKKVVAVIVKELYNLNEILLFTLRRLREKLFTLLNAVFRLKTY